MHLADFADYAPLRSGPGRLLQDQRLVSAALINVARSAGSRAIGRYENMPGDMGLKQVV